MSRPSPIVFAQHAEEFLAAAQREETVKPTTISMPAYFLVAHAIELGLKAYLLTLGQDEKALRRIGHDLGKALNKALEMGLRDVSSFRPDEEDCVRWINEHYWRKDLEYPTTGFKSFPPFSCLTDFAERLLGDIKGKIRQWGLELAWKAPMQ